MLIKNTLDFTWFDLAKYEPVKDFSLNDWYIQLCRRIGLKTYFNPKSSIVLVYLDHLAIIDNGRLITKHYPLDLKRSLEQVWEKLKEDPILECPLQLNSSAVKLASYNDLPHEINHPGYESLKVFIKDSGLGDFSNAHLEAAVLGGTPLAHHDDSLNKALISVDFNASEKALIQQFKRIVRAQQKIKKVKTTKVFTDADISSWKQFKILPCIDLLLYAELNGVSIEQNEIGQFLFPNEYDVSLPDRVRKSVLPKAKKLLTPDTIFAMQYQLSEQKVE